MGSRPSVGRPVKRQLISEAGGKCANPGCPNRLTHIHHIKEWHVVLTHNPDDMVCLCPACHDAVDRGELRVSEELAYSWKSIIRQSLGPRGLLYVEPSTTPPVLLAGELSLTGDSGLVVFSDLEKQHLSFRLLAGDTMLVNAVVSDVQGQTLFEVEEGHFRAAVDFRGDVFQRPGRFKVVHPQEERILPTWVIDQVRVNEPGFADSGDMVVLDMEVERPNVVRVQGCWLSGDRGMVITESGLHLVRSRHSGVATLRGLGATVQYSGPATNALFAFGGKAP